MVTAWAHFDIERFTVEAQTLCRLLSSKFEVKDAAGRVVLGLRPPLRPRGRHGLTVAGIGMRK